ncbi:hypothetical protein Nepgr_016608 [Nepenthes gracilis]|uniref:LOB domain-containing protein n=1 Tax=Nepenthes gracilis TaxID=150966 RepID=A0AAD3SPL6_NEPGR|nr:hypothetical protein Nepgr_016608 [Nepenthes gracilis]
MSSSSNSPCAACKFLRRKCTHECVFAPYFPPDHPQKFASIHKVFGASNVAKLLNELNASQREDAVNSLAYEAEARLRDPVYGCVGLISILQHRLKQVKTDLDNARMELANYIGPSATPPMFHARFLPQHPHNPSPSPLVSYNMPPAVGIPTDPTYAGQFLITEPQQQHQRHRRNPQKLATIAMTEEREAMMRTFDQQQQQRHPQQQHVRFNSGYELGGTVAAVAGGGEFNQMTGSSTVSPSLALGCAFNNPYLIQQQLQEHQAPFLLLQQPVTPRQQHTGAAQAIPPQQSSPQDQTSGDEEGRRLSSCY